MQNDFHLRIDIATSLRQLINEVVVHFSLGNILTFTLIETGYQELNVKTVTDKDTYIVKIFSKEKPIENIKSIITMLIKFNKKGIPVSRLIPDQFGNYLYKTRGKTEDVYICVLEYFEGDSFETKKVTHEDIKAILLYLSQIHMFTDIIVPVDDTWATIRFLEQFEKRSQYLSREEIKTITPIVEEYKMLSIHAKYITVTHGDLQRGHVLKNKNGDYCILDLGCMRNQPRVYDLAIYLAVFCFSLRSVHDDKKIYDLVIQEYGKQNKLGSSEIESLPTLIKSTYATYLLAAQFANRGMHDESSQTKKWISFAQRGLEMSKEIFS